MSRFSEIPTHVLEELLKPAARLRQWPEINVLLWWFPDMILAELEKRDHLISRIRGKVLTLKDAHIYLERAAYQLNHPNEYEFPDVELDHNLALYITRCALNNIDNKVSGRGRPARMTPEIAAAVAEISRLAEETGERGRYRLASKATGLHWKHRRVSYLARQRPKN